MSLTTHQVQLIQESFASVRPIADQAASLFYGRLFEIAPEVQPLFANADMTEQGRKLMQMLATAVAALSDNVEKIIPAIQAMGRRHVNYGVEMGHYAIVGEALIWTLGQGLGEAFTPEVEEAWVTLYGMVVEIATAGVYELS